MSDRRVRLVREARGQVAVLLIGGLVAIGAGAVVLGAFAAGLGRRDAAQRAADQRSAGSATSTPWCGTRRRSSRVGLAVPTSNPRKICCESALTTARPNSSANAVARPDLPAAVGPTTAESTRSGADTRA